MHRNQLLGLANSSRAFEIAEKGRLTQTKSHIKINVSDPNTKLEQSERKAVLYLQRFETVEAAVCGFTDPICDATMAPTIVFQTPFLQLLLANTPRQ